MTCVVSMAALGAALVVVTPGQIAGSILRASHSRDSSQATCVRLMASDPSRPMPQPDRLSRALEGSADGPLTMAPVTLGKETRHVVDPQGPWRQFPKTKGGDLSIFLAYVSYPFPAIGQPDGVAKPELDHLLSWLVLSLDAPGFFAPGIASAPGTQAPAPSGCMFGTSTGGSLEIWNGVTGKEIESTGFTLVSPRPLQRALTTLPRREFTRSSH